LKKFRYIILALVMLIAMPLGFWFYKIYEPDQANITSQSRQEKWAKAKPELGLLKTGDLICRHGRGVISNAFKSFSMRESKYSHTGIVSEEAGEFWVYHAIGGEENKSNKMRRDRLEIFCDPKFVHSFSSFRYDLDSIAMAEFIREIKGYYKTGLEFDTDFDLKTDDKMYCSEFIYKVLLKVSGNENYISLTRFSGYEYVAIDDLYLNSHTTQIYQFTY
jgi:hypothetical protein